MPRGGAQQAALLPENRVIIITGSAAMLGPSISVQNVTPLIALLQQFFMCHRVECLVKINVYHGDRISIM